MSRSDGKVDVWSLGDGRVVLENSWEAHRYKFGPPAEVWIVGYNCHDTNVLYTGADDSLLKSWDSRCGFARPITTSKAHGAGVCSMQMHPRFEHTLATGSYDHSVRIWDTRSMRAPLSQLDVGGGVWRLKWHPHPDYSNTLLSACMRGGVRILNFESSSSLESSSPSGQLLGCVAHYTEAPKGCDWEALAYGCDWITKGFDCAMCSFYDKKMRLLTTQAIE